MQTVPSIKPTPRAAWRPRVRRLGPGRYLVESATTPGLGHQTTASSCGCRAGQFGKICRHQKLAAALEPRFEAWYGQREQQEKGARAAARPSGMAALQQAYGV